ncbi:MAG: hypothetical protein JWM41_1681 [Gemmatimonadetes bacterium]|nr:hypothetical protein [Gemmatimonadota bacterium]
MMRSLSVRAGRSRTRLALRARRGIALFVSMFFVAGVGALALSAIYLTANATLLGKTYEKEDDLKYVSEAALAIGKAELNFNPAALPNSSYVALMSNKTLTSADNQPVSGIKVNLYVGPSGSTSGQFGRFASVVAEARDANGTGFVRRLELTQESFAKYAYWTNSENAAGGGTIVFANNDALWGPVWSNDTITIAASHAAFHDDVGTAAPIISGAQYGTFAKGYQVKQKKILLPSLSSLGGLSALAAAGGFSFTEAYTGGPANVLKRIEFLATDLDASGDSTGANEGFFRVYTAGAGLDNWLRADWPGTASTLPAASSVLNCGDWHKVAGMADLKFFPFATHWHPTAANTWFDTVTAGGMPGGVNAANVATARLEADSAKTSSTTFSGLLQHANVRCYLGGDPHLVAVARTTAAGAGHDTDDKVHKGGDDTTFTAIDQYGRWSQYSATPNGTVAAKRPYDASYLYPLYRGFNTSTKGVIYVSGTVGISGVVRGNITLYTPHTIVLLDDVRYANDPARGVCVDILGTISGENTVVADNSLNSPQVVKTSGGTLYRSMDDTPDMYIHAVMMAVSTSFSVENYSQGSQTAIGCQGTPDGRGCLFLTGGLIQNNRGAVGLVSGEGYIKRYSYDRCAVVNPPPYFPTTGRFQDNRYYELDPVRFNIQSLFNSITPG